MRPLRDPRVVISATTGEVVEVGQTETGAFVVRHELSPPAQVALERIGNQLSVARRNAPWLTAAAGLVAGVTIAALWWSTNAAKKRRKAKRPRRSRPR